MTRAAIYCRISRDRIGAGLGVDRQEEDCRALALTLGWTVVAVYVDNDLSAYSGKPRPRYRELLTAIRSGAVDAVLAWHTDRLHRSPVELEEYIAACDPRGVPTHTVKAGPLDLATPSGRMVARQLGAVARYEVEHMAERQQRAKLQAATDGRWKGGRRPFGYEADGVTVRPAEAAEVVRAAETILAGGSVRSIKNDLNGRGITTTMGGRWGDVTVRRMLLRARNAGLMEHRGEVIGPAEWPAVLPEATWRAVAAILSDPTRRTQFSAVRRWMGTGLYVCGVCDGSVRAMTSGIGKGRPRMRPQYVCVDAYHIARTAEEVDQFVSALVVERLSRPDAAGLLAERSGPDTAQLHQSALATRAKLDELASMYAAGAITGSQLATGTASLRQQLDAIETQLSHTPRGSALAAIVGAPDVATVWESLDLDRRRSVIDALMTVTLLRAGRGRPAGWTPGKSYFRPETVRITWKT